MVEDEVDDGLWLTLDAKVGLLKTIAFDTKRKTLRKLNVN